jgi:hypothetical protein
MRFRRFFEATDIFGFEPKQSGTDPDDNMLARPIQQFDLELMMEFLVRKKLGMQEAFCPFVSEIQWGKEPGSIKLEVDTGLTFYIKKLGIDKTGNPRWVTKKMFQLNRQGYGGLEDSVAQEVYEHISQIAHSRIDAPAEGYAPEDLEHLVTHLENKIKRIAKDIFMPAGIKKLSEYAYIIKLDVRASGLETQDQKRVEQNQTVVTYDKEQGTIRVFNYNVESPTGGPHRWELMENDLDIYFFPTQDREEISECLAVHFKYY